MNPGLRFPVRWRVALALLAALSLIAPAAHAQTPAAASASSAAAKPAPSAQRGKTLFVRQMCYTCHGYAGQGGERGSGPRLVPNLFPYPAFVQQVRHPRQDMPRYSERFTSEADLADIHAYLASIKPGPKAADIAALRD